MAVSRIEPLADQGRAACELLPTTLVMYDVALPAAPLAGLQQEVHESLMTGDDTLKSEGFMYTSSI